MAEGSGEPEQIQPPTRRYWTRRGLAEWLREELDRDVPTIVGIDHAFSFPRNYFEKSELSGNWQEFLETFHRQWPTDELSVDSIRRRNNAPYIGESNWLRLTERWTATAKSVFLFDVQGSVAKSTFSGLPWLLYLRKQCKRPIHFWPFDGWEIPTGRSVVAEVYPALWMRRFARSDRDGDEQAAYAAAAWLQRADRDGSLSHFLKPSLTAEERGIAKIEGWILGVA